MFSSAKQHINHSAFSIASSSSASSSSSSLSSSLSHSQAHVTMEEVWKEINLGSLHQHHQLNIHEPMLRNQNPNNSIFQDFLNRPLNQEPPPPPPLPPPSSSIVTALYGSPLPLPPPAIVLSLNTNTLVASNSHLQNNTHFFEESARFGLFGKKRSQDSDESRGDRRHKRMIKNRESAARSRARKQAYTNELELEIAHLQKENARLKRQKEQLKMAETTQHQTKKILQRSSTSPF